MEEDEEELYSEMQLEDGGRRRVSVTSHNALKVSDCRGALGVPPYVNSSFKAFPVVNYGFCRPLKLTLLYRPRTGLKTVYDARAILIHLLLFSPPFSLFGSWSFNQLTVFPYVIAGVAVSVLYLGTFHMSIQQYPTCAIRAVSSEQGDVYKHTYMYKNLHFSYLSNLSLHQLLSLLQAGEHTCAKVSWVSFCDKWIIRSPCALIIKESPDSVGNSSQKHHTGIFNHKRQV